MGHEVTILITGIVQGVGFRPFCAKLARELGLGGSVRNTSDGVEIILRGEKHIINEYIARVQTENPDASAITSLEIIEESEIDKDFSTTFNIVKSKRMKKQRVLIPPDIATCKDCLEEMKDPSNRRYRYPFINCTNCGPRYTIIQDLPYDRPETTMKKFTMCKDCHAEYTTDTDRRYHAQPNACFECGPELWLQDSEKSISTKGDKAISECVNLIRTGSIVAIKGLGGFHLACDPYNPVAIETLRNRKNRKKKPFALMVKNIEVAEKLCILTTQIKKTLLSSKRPIVICYKRNNCGICESIAPGQNDLGLMLPYTPLHHLIMESFDALVMTSANISDSPIIAANEEALEKLGSIADSFLFHNRDIHMPIDDSVISVSGRMKILLRRSRGFVPAPFPLPVNSPVILAAGGEMKSTFSITQEKILFPGQYLGDLKQIPTINYYRRALKHFMKLYNLKPEFLVHDMHPQYVSTQIALEETDIKKENIMTVQHHHAHLASCLLENRHQGKAIGLILDGTGFGTDGTIWGGEFLVGDIEDFYRAGHFLSSNLPGGEKAVLEPWRYALSLLTQTFGHDKTIDIARSIWPEFRNTIPLISGTVHSGPVTTSAGRLFDGVSALLNICTLSSFDGEAAVLLESNAKGTAKAPFESFKENDKWILDWRNAIAWIIHNRTKISEKEISAGFHYGLARELTRISSSIASETGIKHVALSGGVWQNRRLLNLTYTLLEREGMKTLVHKTLSPNDECVSTGQAVIGAFRWGKN